MADTTAFGKALDWLSINIVASVNREFPWHAPLARAETALRGVLPPRFNAFWDWCMANQDPWVKRAKLPLMNPFHVVVIILLYLCTVWFGRLVMRSMSPFRPKLWQILHNAVMTLLAFFMMSEALRQAFVVNNYGVLLNGMDYAPSGEAMARICWIFYASKITEFGDTLIMVARKADRQVSFLHLYHHTSIFAIWWVVVSYGPGGDAYLSVVLNSFVHVVMYSYYFMATIGMPLLVIKPYITMLQMAQFCAFATQAITDLVWNMFEPIAYPPFLAWILFIYMITLLALFGNFFIKDAERRRKLRAAEKKAKAKKAT